MRIQQARRKSIFTCLDSHRTEKWRAMMTNMNYRESNVKKISLPVSKALPAPRIHSAHLLQGAQMLIIEHAGAEYLLRITGKGKLILTK